MNIRLLAIALISLFVISDGKVGESRRLPQSTTTTEEIELFGVVASRDRCWDPYGWCRLYIEQTCSVYAQGSDSYAYCFLANKARCTLAQIANARALLFARGSAELSATQHGNNGALFEVHLNTSASAMTLTTAFAATHSGAGVSGDFVAFSRADPSKICDWVSERSGSYWYWRTYYNIYCADAESVSLAYGSVEASSKSSSLARAIARSSASFSTDVDVEGSNIHNVKAKVVNGFSSFTGAHGRSISTAYAETITTAIAASFAQTCEDEYYRTCRRYWWWWTRCSINNPVEVCNTAQSYAVSSAESFAEAFASTAATAVSNTELTVIYDAEVDKSPGNPLTLGLSGSLNGTVGIGISAYCS